jgi:hypothetical protein
VGAAVPHRDTEALHRADGDVRPPLPRRGEQGERERVSGDGHPSAGGDHGGGDGAQGSDLAGGARVLQQRPEDRTAGEGVGDDVPAAGHAVALGVEDGQVPRAEVEVDQLDPQRLRAGLQHRPGLRQHVGVHEEDGVLGRLRGPAQQGHGLGGGGGLVEQARVGDVETGQVRDQRLEGQQRLEPALADLGLVGRVGGVPGGVLEHVAPHHGRGDRAVVAEADHRLDDGVAGGDAPQRRQGVLLVEGRREVERLRHTDGRGDGGLDERLEALVPGRAGVGTCVGDVPEVAVGERGAGARVGAGVHAAPRASGGPSAGLVCRTPTVGREPSCVPVPCGPGA